MTSKPKKLPKLSKPLIIFEITICDLKESERKLVAKLLQVTGMSKTSKIEIEKCIFIARKHKVMLDIDLTRIYGVEARTLNQAVRRNPNRFPDDFMVQLNEKEAEFLRLQVGASKVGRGGRRYLPYVFNEHGALMLTNVLHNETAVEASIQVVRSFLQLREFVISHAELSKKLFELEKKYDSQFKVVFQAVEQLMAISDIPTKKIGI